jgi:hypothetical protein
MKEKSAIKDLRTMNLAKWMGFLTFCMTEILILIGFIFCETRDIVSLLGVQAGIFALVWGAIFGKNIIDLKEGQK